MILWKDARVLLERCKDPDFIEQFTIKKNPAVNKEDLTVKDKVQLQIELYSQ